MIDIVLLAGFLGSGKTTVLNELIRQHPHIKLGMLVNDFGEVPVDGSLLKEENPQLDREGGSIYEIGNGSIFCACLKAPFLYGLQYFQKEKPDILFIEASGLSDPSSMTKILIEHSMADDFRVARILTLVDPMRTAKLAHVLEVIPRQIEAADDILINKADLATPEEVAASIELVRGLNDRAAVQTGTYGRFDFSSLLEKDREEKEGERESCNTPESRPASLFLATEKGRRDELEGFLKKAEDLFYRLKGFIFLEESLYYVSDTGRGFSFTPAGKSRVKPGLTVLCPLENSRSILDLWETCFPAPPFTRITGKKTSARRSIGVVS